MKQLSFLNPFSPAKPPTQPPHVTPAAAQPAQPGQAVGQVYLWVNLPDLHALGGIPGLGAPLDMAVIPKLGDERLPGTYHDPERVDDMFVIIKTAPDRARDIDAMMEMFAKRAKVHLRTKITKDLPGAGWKWVAGK